MLTSHKNNIIISIHTRDNNGNFKKEGAGFDGEFC